MVCGRCGEPLGAKVIPLRRRGRRLRWGPSAVRGPRLWKLALLALVGLSGVLAALQMGEQQQRPQPWEQRGLGLRQRMT